MLIPKESNGHLVMVEGDLFSINDKLQRGCGDCGWAGDPFLGLYVIPRRYGNGYCVIHKQPGEKAVRLWMSNPLDNHAVDHRIIDFFRDARKNWELGSKVADMMDAHDAKVQHDIDRKGKEITDGISDMTKSFMKKHDMLPTKHKIDRKK